MDTPEANSYWTHDLSPFLIEFGDGFGIRYYGLAYVLGFVVGLWLLSRYFKKGISPLKPEQQMDLFFALMIGVMAGGRLGYFLFYTPEELVRDPLSLFKVWKGGMASHGGFLGVAAAIWYTARKTQQPFWKIADIVCTLAPAGILFGRIANFINGELWGKPGSIAWAVLFPDSPDGGTIPRHPSQLYEAALEGLLLLIYTQWRVWKTPCLKERPGQLTGEFLLGYAIARIIGEQFREPDSYVSLTLGMSRGTTLSLVLFVFAILILLLIKRQKTGKTENS